MKRSQKSGSGRKSSPVAGQSVRDGGIVGGGVVGGAEVGGAEVGGGADELPGATLELEDG